MMKRKNNLDERQELKLLHIEHNGCWIAFWGLVISMMLQLVFGNSSPENLAGEWIVFMCLAIYLMAGCIKNGIWDRTLKPNFKTNVIASGIAGSIMGIIWFFVSYHNYHNLIGSIMTGIFMFFSVGILCLVMLMISSQIYKKRVKKLEEIDEDPTDKE